MPQMSPMWWIPLEMLFITCLLIMTTKLYFTTKISIKANKQKIKKMIKWEW